MDAGPIIRECGKDLAAAWLHPVVAEEMGAEQSDVIEVAHPTVYHRCGIDVMLAKKE